MLKFKPDEKIRRITKLLAKYKYILLVIAVGLILLILPTSRGEDPQPAAEITTEEEVFDLEEFENKLQAALQKMDGVGKATVVLTLKTGSERILATDPTVSYRTSSRGEEIESDMDSSETTVIISSGSGTQEAIVVKRLYPEFQGALVICQGGGSAAVRLSVTEAVSAVTGLGSDKIKVNKMS